MINGQPFELFYVNWQMTRFKCVEALSFISDIAEKWHLYVYNLQMLHGSVFKIKMPFYCVLGALSCFVSSSVPTIPGNSLPHSPCSAQYPCLWWEYWIRCHFISGGCWWALWGELEHIETKAWLLPAFTSTKAKFTRFSCGPLVVLFYFVQFDRFMARFCVCFLGICYWNGICICLF